MKIERIDDARMSARCAAKINLFLNVSVRRPDGYHELQSVMQRVDVFDELTFALADGPEITLGVAAAPCGCAAEDNIVVRAARLLQRAHGARHGAAITLTKHIPVAAGLGGGSADAAAALVALAGLWNIAASPGELSALAVQLGADVPFFLGGPAALCEGVGERLTPVAPRRLSIVLWNPCVPLATKEVYAAFDAVPRPVRQPGPFLEAYRSGSARDVAAAAWNNLAFAAGELMPRLHAMEDECRAHGALAAWVSGSGPTVAALCDDDARAAALAAQLRTAHPGEYVHAGSTLC
ncbi:4-(cytidine 5'-diphospho)-2-C-methyl-D-erythritol kinase [bacterium]|nr:4-(cytidine 5'-diphospho)-2-C-methyl-D-erythritol kinase [bacterium]